MNTTRSRSRRAAASASDTLASSPSAPPISTNAPSWMPRAPGTTNAALLIAWITASIAMACGSRAAGRGNRARARSRRRPGSRRRTARRGTRRHRRGGGRGGRAPGRSQRGASHAREPAAGWPVDERGDPGKPAGTLGQHERPAEDEHRRDAGDELRPDRSHVPARKQQTKPEQANADCVRPRAPCRRRGSPRPRRVTRRGAAGTGTPRSRRRRVPPAARR